MPSNGLSELSAGGLETHAGPTGPAPFPGRLAIVAFVRRLFAIGVGPSAVVAALLVALIALVLDLHLNIWIDEAFTLYTTGLGPVVAWSRAVNFEAQPPLFFVLEAVWRLPDEASIGFARVLSTLVTAAAVATIVVAAKKLAPRVPPIAVALATALNPFFLWAASEMRGYSLVLLVGAGLALTFYAGFLTDERSRRAQVLYVVCAVAGLYTQYYVGFFLVAQGLTLIALRRGAFRAYLVATAAIAVAVVPLIPIALLQVRSSGEFVLPTTLGRSLHLVLDAVFVTVMPHWTGWSRAIKVGGFGLAAATVVALVALGRPPIARGAARAFIAQWLIGLAVFVVAFHVLGAAFTLMKYVSVIVPSTLLASFMLLSALRRHRIAAGCIAVATYVIFTGTDLYGEYRPPAVKPGDFQRIAQTVSADARATPIAVFPAELAEPLSWYLTRPVISIPAPMPYTMSYVRAMTLTSEAEVARVLDPVRADAPQLWLVTADSCEARPVRIYDFQCHFLNAYLAGRYRLVRNVAFRGARARLYIRFPAASADSQESRHAH